jgi:UDP-N-acetylglucosamine transferase subunit ALG13
VILCTLGTHPAPFDRLVDWVLAARGDEDAIIQHGSTPPRSGVDGVLWRQALPYEELTALMRAADVMVCHAGVGTLMNAISLGVKPVTIPRLRAHGEHVDDHQLEIAGELDRTGRIFSCLDQDHFESALAAARNVDGSREPVGGELRLIAIEAAGGDPELAR